MGAQNTVVFLGGLGRSGTTLLERLLGELPGVIPLGEVAHLWRRGLLEGEPCGCGKPLPDCDFWRAIGDAAFGGWAGFDVQRHLELGSRIDRTRHIPAMGFRDRTALRSYIDAYIRVYRAAREVSGCPIVIDSSKHASLAHCLRHAEGVDLKVVHVIRDSRAVAYSWAKEIDGMTRWHPVRTALHWTAQNIGMEALRPAARVVYEDLLREPGPRLRAVAEAIGIPADPMPVSGGAATLSTAHTASGNPMRFRTGALELRADEAWRAHLPAQDRRTVTALTWPLLRRYYS